MTIASASSATAAAATAHKTSPWPVFWVASVASFLVSLDATMLYAAFGALQVGFPRASAAELSWVLNAYTVVYAAMLIPSGGLADAYGRKRVFLFGVTLFIAASAACGLAGEVSWLVAARVLQAIGAALQWRGHSLNSTDASALAAARADLLRQKPLVRTYNSSNFEDVLLSGDVWLEQAWNGQIAKAMELDPEIAYVLPREGSTLFIDNLAIPKDARDPALAHAFIDFTLEAEIAAEICNTMKYSTPNRAALPLLPSELRANPAVFPPAEAVARLELIQDLGEATVVYDRLWTEVKSRYRGGSREERASSAA